MGKGDRQVAPTDDFHDDDAFSPPPWMKMQGTACRALTTADCPLPTADYLLPTVFTINVGKPSNPFPVVETLRNNLFRCSRQFGAKRLVHQ